MVLKEKQAHGTDERPPFRKISRKLNVMFAQLERNTRDPISKWLRGRSFKGGKK